MYRAPPPNCGRSTSSWGADSPARLLWLLSSLPRLREVVPTRRHQRDRDGNACTRSRHPGCPPRRMDTLSSVALTPRPTVVNDGGGAQANVRLNSHQSGPPPRHRRHDSSSPRAFLASPASRSCFVSCLLVLSGNLSRAPPSVCGLSVTASFQVHTSGRVWPTHVSISNGQTPLYPLQTGTAPRQNRPFLAARLLAPTAATVDDRPNLSRSSVPVPASSGDRAAER